MLKKEKIKFKGRDMNIQFTLGGNNNLLGFQQEIDKFTQIKTTNSINEGRDQEVRRFKFILENIFLLFSFWDGLNYGSSFIKAGFTSAEINGLSDNFLNSYFILDFYDTFNPNIQNKIFSTYLTKLGLDDHSWFILTDDIQFYKLAIPIDYFDKQTGNTITGYTRFSFYNAKTGKVQLFYNNDNAGLTTPEKMYFKTILTLNNKTWKIDTPAITHPVIKNIPAKELKYSENKGYIDRYNETFEDYDNLQQVFPSGNTFNYKDAKYDVTK